MSAELSHQAPCQQAQDKDSRKKIVLIYEPIMVRKNFYL